MQREVVIDVRNPLTWRTRPKSLIKVIVLCRGEKICELEWKWQHPTEQKREIRSFLDAVRKVLDIVCSPLDRGRKGRLLRFTGRIASKWPLGTSEFKVLIEKLINPALEALGHKPITLRR